jgi:hypothetical protein
MSTVVDDPEVRPLPHGLRSRHEDDLKYRRRLDRPGCLRCLRKRGNHRGGEEQRDDDRQTRPPTPPCRARRALYGHEVHATAAAPGTPGTSLIDNTAFADARRFAEFEREVIVVAHSSALLFVVSTTMADSPIS